MKCDAEKWNDFSILECYYGSWVKKNRFGNQWLTKFQLCLVQALRKSHGLSQEQLAEKLDVSRQAISKWESGQANPDINNLLKLSSIYEVSTDYLLSGKEIDSQIVYNDRIIYKEKRGFKKLHDLPASMRVALAILIIAFGVFIVIPILFILSMEFLSFIF